jgi:hypothetical protein
MKYAIFILTTILFSCESSLSGSVQTDRYVCNCDQKRELQEFVKTSIKSANNMSDEEMEDVIKELRISGIELYCEKKQVWLNRGSWDIDWTKQKFDSCETVMENW